MQRFRDADMEVLRWCRCRGGEEQFRADERCRGGGADAEVLRCRYGGHSWLRHEPFGSFVRRVTNVLHLAFFASRPTNMSCILKRHILKG